MPFLSVSDVSKQFGGVTAVDHVSFAVDRGQVVGFLGPNGAGKSTTMRMITQYYEPDTGAITLDGVPLADASRAAKRRIGYLAENNPLYEDMLVHDYLAFIADLRQLEGPPRRQRWTPRLRRPVSKASTTGRSPSSRRDSASASAWRRRSCIAPICWCSTSRPRGSTRTSASRSAG